MSQKKVLKITLLLIVSLALTTVSAMAATKSYRGYSKLPEPPATSLGESVYRESDCSMCHGEMGDGEGFLAEGLDPKPRDFTDFLQMKSIPDMQMENAILKGVKGTGMPAHPDFNDEQIAELIVYLRSLLAETYLTVNLCFNASHVIDVGRKGLDLSEFKIVVEKPDLLSIKRKGHLITLTSENWETFKQLVKRRVIRTYVHLIEKDNTVSLIALRLHRCLR